MIIFHVKNYLLSFIDISVDGSTFKIIYRLINHNQ